MIATKIIFFAFFGSDPILAKKLTKMFSNPNVIIYTPFIGHSSEKKIEKYEIDDFWIK